MVCLFFPTTAHTRFLGEPSAGKCSPFLISLSLSLLFALLPGHGATATLFLPFNAPIAHDVERLAVVSDLSMFGKPYSIAAIRRALAQAQPRYPMLAQRIARYMDAVYGCGSCLTHIGAELRLGG